MGRPRKAGKRHPNGKLVQPTAEERQADRLADTLYSVGFQRVVAMGWDKTEGNCTRAAGDQRLGTMAGRLNVAERIQKREMDGLEKFAEVWRQYSRATGIPMAAPSSQHIATTDDHPPLSDGAALTLVDPDTRDLRAEQAYKAATGALSSVRDQSSPCLLSVAEGVAMASETMFGEGARVPGALDAYSVARIRLAGALLARHFGVG